jgi:alpha-glucosidase
VDYHGAFKPAGLEYRFPNLLSYEGVRGLEQGGGCQPENNIWLPFMRGAVGPMDFTPGAMLNYQPENYAARRPNNASVGTRAHQLAMYVLYESGVQMLADNPTLYYRNDDCTRFIASVPVTWDESYVLQAEAGKYLVEAKCKDDVWYLGGMMGKEPGEGIDVTIRIDFLGSGAARHLTLFEDGINAHHQGMDYRVREMTVRNGDVITVHMARNGGFAAQIK